MTRMANASYQRNMNSALWSSVEENRDAYYEWLALIGPDCTEEEEAAGWNIDETEEAGEGRSMKRIAAQQQSSRTPGPSQRQVSKQAQRQTWRSDRKRRERKRNVGRAGKIGQLDEPTACFRGESGQLSEYAVYGYGRLRLRGGGGGAVETGMTTEDRRERWKEHNKCLQGMVTDNGDGSFRMGWKSRPEMLSLRKGGWWQQPWSRLYSPEDTAEKTGDWTREVVGPSATFWSEESKRERAMKHLAGELVWWTTMAVELAAGYEDLAAGYAEQAARLAESKAELAESKATSNTWTGPTFGTIIGVDGQSWGVAIKKETGWDGGTVWRLHRSGRIAKESTRGVKWVWGIHIN